MSPARRKWTDAQRAEALRLYVGEGGLAEAHKVTGIPKETIRRWARETGAETGRVESKKQTEAATAARAELLEVRRLAQSEEKLENSGRAVSLIGRRLLDAQADEELIAEARQRWRDALATIPLAAGMSAEEEAKAVKAARRAEFAYRFACSQRPDLRELVGVTTRELADHLALEGLAGDDQATGDLVVEFMAPTHESPEEARKRIKSVDQLAREAEGPAAGREAG